MSQRSLILKNTGLYSIVEILPPAINLLLLPIYTKYLSPEEYGILALIQVLILMIGTGATLQIDGAISRFYYDYDESNVAILFSTVFYSSIILCTFLLGTFSLFFDSIITTLYPNTSIAFAPLILISFLGILCDQTSKSVSNLLVCQEKGYIVAIRSSLRIVIELVLGLLLVVVLKWGVLGILTTHLAVSICTFCVNIVIARNYFTLAFSWKIFRNCIDYSWPLVPYAMGGFLFKFSDQIILEKMVPLETIGVYAIASKFSLVLKIPIEAAIKALVPNFFRLASKDIKHAITIFQSVINKWAVVVSTAYLGLVYFSEEAILILMPSHYKDSFSLIPILSLCYIIRGMYSFSSYPLFYNKKTKILPLFTVISGLINVCLNILFIPKYGVLAAAWTTVIAFLCSLILVQTAAKRAQSIQYDWFTLIKIYGITSIFSSFILFDDDLSNLQRVTAKIIIFSIYCFIILYSDIGGARSEITAILKLRQPPSEKRP